MSTLAKYLCGVYICTSTLVYCPVQQYYNNNNVTSNVAASIISTDNVQMSTTREAKEESDIPHTLMLRSILATANSPIEVEVAEETETLKYGQVIEDYSRFREAPNYDSEVISLFRKGMTFEIIEKSSNWYKIKYNEEEGFIDISLVEQYQENPPYEVYVETIEEVNGEPHYNPSNLRELSNLSAAQIYNLLEGSALQTLSDAYYYYEKMYNVNAIFLIALNNEESAHGRSSLAISHNNLGGVKDGNSWRYFNDWGESLEYIANLIDSMYLTEGAAYYNGLSIWNVNQRYCEGDSWAGNLNTIAYELISKAQK